MNHFRRLRSKKEMPSPPPMPPADDTPAGTCGAGGQPVCAGDALDGAKPSYTAVLLYIFGTCVHSCISSLHLIILRLSPSVLWSAERELPDRLSSSALLCTF